MPDISQSTFTTVTKLINYFFLKDDNAEDLAETFGNQLGLTKSLKKALQHKLREEINSCLSGP